MMPNRDAAIERLRKAAYRWLNRRDNLNYTSREQLIALNEYRKACFAFPETERDPKNVLPDPKALLESLARQDAELASANALEGR